MGHIALIFVWPGLWSKGSEFREVAFAITIRRFCLRATPRQ